jgi:hypothetical protein
MMRWCYACVQNTWHTLRRRDDGVETLCCSRCGGQLPPMP